MTSWKDVIINIFATLKYIVIFMIIIYVAYFLAENSMGLIKPPHIELGTKDKLKEEEEKCLVATIHADARKADDSDSEVRKEIARTVIRYASKFRRDICDVFREGLTLVPQGYSRPSFFGIPSFVGRYVSYIETVEATDSSWNSDLSLVRGLARPVKGCATHYIRGPRATDTSSQPEAARERIRKEMVSVGHAQADDKEVGAAEFFCPK